MFLGSQETGGARVKSLKEIRENGVIIQQWDSSCAAAALATVFTYVLRHPVSERAVAQGMLKRTDPLKVKHRGGFSLLDMKRFVETRGYQARAMKGFAIDELVFFDGAIVPINQFGYNHYVVFRGINADKKVHLADPAFGNRTLSKKNFEEMWMDGIVFIVTDGQ
jgi:predicted double-glycine peptidase